MTGEIHWLCLMITCSDAHWEDNQFYPIQVTKYFLFEHYIFTNLNGVHRI